MNDLNISNIQRRKPRRSMLGTHRGYSIGLSLNEEPLPQVSGTEADTSTISVNITNMVRRQPRKSMLGTRNIRRDSIFSLLPETSFNESSADVDTAEGTISSPPKKKLDTIFSQEANDSFEEHETIIMANESEESVLATTLMDNTIVEMSSNSSSSGGGGSRNVVARLENDDTLLLDKTVTKAESQPDADADADTDTVAEHSSTLGDVIDMLNSIIENNTRKVNRCHKQIDELRGEIEERSRETENIINLKCRLTKQYNLSGDGGGGGGGAGGVDDAGAGSGAGDDAIRQPAKIATPAVASRSENKSPEERRRRATTTVVADDKTTERRNDENESPNLMAAPSRQMIRELRSSIKFLKTPRQSRRTRSSSNSAILTPHSMSFSIKRQYEELLKCRK